MQPEGINLGTMYKSYGFYGPKDFTKLYTLKRGQVSNIPHHKKGHYLISDTIKRKVLNNGYTVN